MTRLSSKLNGSRYYFSIHLYKYVINYRFRFYTFFVLLIQRTSHKNSYEKKRKEKLLSRIFVVDIKCDE